MNRSTATLLRHLLLALMLVAGQAMLVAHGAEHFTEPAHSDCELCLHAQAQAGAPPATACPLAVDHVIDRIAAAMPCPAVAGVAAHPIRGPPIPTR